MQGYLKVRSYGIRGRSMGMVEVVSLIAIGVMLSILFGILIAKYDERD